MHGHWLVRRSPAALGNSVTNHYHGNDNIYFKWLSRSRKVELLEMFTLEHYSIVEYLFIHISKFSINNKKEGGYKYKTQWNRHAHNRHSANQTLPKKADIQGPPSPKSKWGTCKKHFFVSFYKFKRNPSQYWRPKDPKTHKLILKISL